MTGNPKSPNENFSTLLDSLSSRELRLVAAYSDPASPAYHDSPRAAAQVGFTGTRPSLSAIASRALAKARKCSPLAIIMREAGCTLEAVFERLHEHMNARRTVVFLTKDEQVIHADAGPDYKVQEKARQTLAKLWGVYDGKRQEQELLAAVSDAIVAGEDEQRPDSHQDASEGECGNDTSTGHERAEKDPVAENTGAPVAAGDYTASAVATAIVPTCSTEDVAQPNPARQGEVILPPASRPDTRTMIDRASEAIGNELQRDDLADSDRVKLRQVQVGLMHERNQSDQIDLERKKSGLEDDDLADNFGAITIDGVRLDQPPGNGSQLSPELQAMKQRVAKMDVTSRMLLSSALQAKRNMMKAGLEMADAEAAEEAAKGGTPDTTPTEEPGPETPPSKPEPESAK